MPLPPASALPPLAAGDVTFGQVARLVGLRLKQTTVSPGQPLEFSLLWESLERPELDYTVFTHLLDEHGQLVAGHDSQPVDGSYPTSIWSLQERILDPRQLPIPENLPPGRYRLALGLYYQPTGQRLPVYLPDGALADQGRFILPQLITVEGRE